MRHSSLLLLAIHAKPAGWQETRAVVKSLFDATCKSPTFGADPKPIWQDEGCVPQTSPIDLRMCLIIVWFASIYGIK
jgi:hypothetical protein